MQRYMQRYYYDCPLGYLEMAPVACEAWRAEVCAYHARMRRRFEVGHTVALIGSRIPWVRITQLKPLRGQYRGVVYRVRRDRLGELLTEATPCSKRWRPPQGMPAKKIGSSPRWIRSADVRPNPQSVQAS